MKLRNNLHLLKSVFAKGVFADEPVIRVDPAFWFTKPGTLAVTVAGSIIYPLKGEDYIDSLTSFDRIVSSKRDGKLMVTGSYSLPLCDQVWFPPKPTPMLHEDSVVRGFVERRQEQLDDDVIKGLNILVSRKYAELNGCAVPRLASYLNITDVTVWQLANTVTEEITVNASVERYGREYSYTSANGGRGFITNLKRRCADSVYQAAIRARVEMSEKYYFTAVGMKDR